MASLHFNHRGGTRHSFLSNVGNKIKHAAEIAGAVKGIYDVGRMVYHGARAIAPAAAAVGMCL